MTLQVLKPQNNPRDKAQVDLFAAANPLQLLPAIKPPGYTGSLSHLERLLTRWRHGGPTPLTPVEAEVSTPAVPMVSPNVAAALCMKPLGLLTLQQAGMVDRL